VRSRIFFAKKDVLRNADQVSVFILKGEFVNRKLCLNWTVVSANLAESNLGLPIND
jgi:hypothetical protein